MKIPNTCTLYYISDIQMRRLKLIKATVVNEIANQQYISDEQEAKIRQEMTQEDVGFDHEQDIKTQAEELEQYDTDIPEY